MVVFWHWLLNFFCQLLFYICFSLWAGISVYLPCLKYFQCFLFQQKNCLIWCPIVYMSMHLFILVLEARLHYRLLRYIVCWMADLYMNSVRPITFAKLINKNIFLERPTWFLQFFVPCFYTVNVVTSFPWQVSWIFRKYSAIFFFFF